MFGTNNGIAGQVLVGFGTDEQKKQWLPRIASGEVVASFALTEPGAGSNPAALRTPRPSQTATSGSSTGRSGSSPTPPSPDLFVVFARTAGPAAAATGHRGVPGPGGHAGRRRSGRRTRRWARRAPGPPTSPSTTCSVPADALVGGEESGYRAAMTSLARGRVHIAALAVGSAQRALDESVAYAASTTQGGEPIGNFQLVQAMLADQQTGVTAGRAMVREAARAYVSGADRRIAPSAAKLFCTEMAVPGRRPRGADPRRHRLHARGPGRADLPRRPPAAPVRGHQRDPAADRRRRARPRRTRGLVNAARPPQDQGRADRAAQYASGVSPSAPSSSATPSAAPPPPPRCGWPAARCPPAREHAPDPRPGQYRGHGELVDADAELPRDGGGPQRAGLPSCRPGPAARWRPTP